MCRMWALHSAAPTPIAPWLIGGDRSIVRQSRCDRAGDHHRDGWGIGWYGSAGVEVVRSTLPACEDAGFAAAAATVRSHLAVAHVRDASVGNVQPENCHPFAFDSWLFCHNGTIEGFARVARRYVDDILPELRGMRRGETDSEHLFYLLLSNILRERGGSGPDDAALDVDGVYEVVRSTLRRVLGWSATADVPPPTGLNLLLTDGRVLAAVRYGRSLWMRTMVTDFGMRPTVVVASEPTDADLSDVPAPADGWREIADRSILTVDAAGRTHVRPV